MISFFLGFIAGSILTTFGLFIAYSLASSAVTGDKMWADYWTLMEDGREDQAQHYFHDVIEPWLFDNVQ